MFRLQLSLLALSLAFSPLAFAEEWKPAAGKLMTRWAKEVSPSSVLPEHPRPQMVRKDWQTLNGLWDYAIRPRSEGQPEKWDGKIMVPFAVESALSGVMKEVGDKNKLWYRRTFTTPKNNGRLLLHFEAVDWAAEVFVNGRRLAEHKGGFDPFSVEITTALKTAGEQELVVAVYDPSDASYQPRGSRQTEQHLVHPRHWHLANRLAGIGQHELLARHSSHARRRSFCRAVQRAIGRWHAGSWARTSVQSHRAR
jgi:hypothetical protein